MKKHIDYTYAAAEDPDFVHYLCGWFASRPEELQHAAYTFLLNRGRVEEAEKESEKTLDQPA